MKKEIEKVSSDTELAEITCEGISLVEFWASWCGPCKQMGPIMEEVSEKVGDSVKLAIYDVDKDPTVPAELGIRSIPTMIVFKDSLEKARIVGWVPADNLVKAIKGVASE